VQKPAVVHDVAGTNVQRQAATLLQLLALKELQLGKPSVSNSTRAGRDVR
jgi:hypothetical protein